MKDQHKHIKGYRDLSEDEINLMNKIKEHQEETRKIVEILQGMRAEQQKTPSSEDVALSAEQLSESQRCLALAKTNLQQGGMWLVRAVALPDSF